MKKTLSAILACVLLIGCLFTLASCGKSLSGTYEIDLGVSEITYEFGAFGKVTRTVDPLVGDETVEEGKYKFNDAGDEITICTVKKRKSITLLRAGKTTNILNCLDRNPDWFSLSKGDNVFAYTAESGGTNLQFKINHQVIYEGV